MPVLLLLGEDDSDLRVPPTQRRGHRSEEGVVEMSMVFPKETIQSTLTAGKSQGVWAGLLYQMLRHRWWLRDALFPPYPCFNVHKSCSCLSKNRLGRGIELPALCFTVHYRSCLTSNTPILCWGFSIPMKSRLDTLRRVTIEGVGGAGDLPVRPRL